MIMSITTTMMIRRIRRLVRVIDIINYPIQLLSQKPHTEHGTIESTLNTKSRLPVGIVGYNQPAVQNCGDVYRECAAAAADICITVQHDNCFWQKVQI